MINKTPVISSNTGGIPEVNVQGVTGFLSDVGNVEEMANNALKIIKDNAVLEKFKKNAVENAYKYDILKILPLYEKVYEKALEYRFKNVH